MTEERTALTDDQVDVVVAEIVKLLPEGPQLYPADEVTDEPLENRIAELIREAALEGVHDELPHSIAVVVDEMVPREGRSADNPTLRYDLDNFERAQFRFKLAVGLN